MRYIILSLVVSVKKFMKILMVPLCKSQRVQSGMKGLSSVHCFCFSMFLHQVRQDGNSIQWTVDCEYGKSIWRTVHPLGYLEQFMLVLESFQHLNRLESATHTTQCIAKDSKICTRCRPIFKTIICLLPYCLKFNRK